MLSESARSRSPIICCSIINHTRSTNVSVRGNRSKRVLLADCEAPYRLEPHERCFRLFRLWWRRRALRCSSWFVPFSVLFLLDVADLSQEIVLQNRKTNGRQPVSPHSCEKQSLVDIPRLRSTPCPRPSRRRGHQRFRRPTSQRTAGASFGRCQMLAAAVGAAVAVPQ